VANDQSRPTISSYYADPDRNDVELQVDRFADTTEATNWMRGPAFAQNPIGVEFDIEHFIADFRKGTPVDELMRRPAFPAATQTGRRYNASWTTSAPARSM
jgi:hypothetical protein